MEKSLKEKAIKIKGKDYVQVAQRVVFFNEEYPNGMIQTELISPIDSPVVFIKAKITPDAEKPERYFTGYSQAKIDDGYINKTSALENCETSAVGRALAMLGIGVIDSIASVDEINKAKNTAKEDDFLADAGEPLVITECREKLTSSTTLEELKNAYSSLSPKLKKQFATLKDELKVKLESNVSK